MPGENPGECPQAGVPRSSAARGCSDHAVMATPLRRDVPRLHSRSRRSPGPTEPDARLSALGTTGARSRRRIVRGQWQPYGARSWCSSTIRPPALRVSCGDPPAIRRPCRSGHAFELRVSTTGSANLVMWWFPRERGSMPGLVVRTGPIWLTENDLVTVDGMVMTSPARSAVDAADGTDRRGPPQRWSSRPMQQSSRHRTRSHCLDQFLLVQQVAVIGGHGGAREMTRSPKRMRTETIRLAGFPETRSSVGGRHRNRTTDLSGPWRCLSRIRRFLVRIDPVRTTRTRPCGWWTP